jgi:hypothetical protein
MIPDPDSARYMVESLYPPEPLTEPTPSYGAIIRNHALRPDDVLTLVRRVLAETARAELSPMDAGLALSIVTGAYHRNRLKELGGAHVLLSKQMAANASVEMYRQARRLPTLIGDLALLNALLACYINDLRTVGVREE